MARFRSLSLLAVTLLFSVRAAHAADPPAARAVNAQNAQQEGSPRVAADVVVTAEAEPVDQRSLAVAATVIDAAEIQRSTQSNVLELLRRVPSLDVVQSGGPGKVASLFLRGTNSNQTLVLVDGVKLNTPYFGGIDLTGLSTVNLERIEAVRGPFSALYGSEAVGGVIQLFTKRGGAPGLSGLAELSIGSKSTREGSLSASLVEGPIAATVGFRRMTTDNDLPNDFFAVTNASASLEATLSPGAKVGFVIRRDEGRSGVPFSGDQATPNRTTTLETTTASVPFSFALGQDFQLDAAATFSKERPTFSDIDDPYGFTFSRTDAERIGGRVTLSRTLGAQRLTVGTDYERTLVTNEDAYALELDDLSIRTWSLFLEDRLTLLDDKLSATVGIRRDDHSAFGSATSPRVSIAYRPIPSLKLRAAAGSAFRSPTTGELYYPYSGNPALQPERSVAYELGAEVTVAPHATAEVTLFQNNIRDLITYEFATSLNTNVNRARTSGVELSLQGSLGERLFGRVSYSYLDAQDLDLDRALLRRPHHRASATVGALLGQGASAELTGFFVGSRNDVDATTFAAVQDASYLRLDAGIRGPRVLDHFIPILRVTNLLGREYVEAAGYPSPGRRLSVGLQVAF